MSEEGKKCCNGPAKLLSDGDASVEIDAAMGASGICFWWWRRPGAEYGRHGDGELFYILCYVCQLSAVCCGVWDGDRGQCKEREDLNFTGTYVNGLFESRSNIGISIKTVCDNKCLSPI